MSGQQNLFQYQGTNSGTITHAAISQNTGFYRPSGASGTLTITNAYSHLINALLDYGAGFTFTNRWGIYQAGASDKNYFAANMLLGSTTDNGNRLQVTGNGYISGNVGVGTLPSSYNLEILGGNANTLKLNNDGSQYVQLLFERNSIVNSGGDFLLDGTNGTFGIRTLAAYPIVLSTSSVAGNPVEVIRITPSGRFGYGTSTPARIFTIFGGANTSRIILQNTATGQAINFGLDITMDGTNAQFWNYQNGYTSFGTNNTERGRFTDAGNFLVGTTTDAGQKLYLNGSLRIDGQTSGTAGGSSGQHLIINCDGTTYKIALLNN
jgi:hypothetical protein